MHKAVFLQEVKGKLELHLTSKARCHLKVNINLRKESVCRTLKKVRFPRQICCFVMLNVNKMMNLTGSLLTPPHPTPGVPCVFVHPAVCVALLNAGRRRMCEAAGGPAAV